MQASEYQSHRWTVYLRSPSGEDLQHVIKKVRGIWGWAAVQQLQPGRVFDNPPGAAPDLLGHFLAIVLQMCTPAAGRNLNLYAVAVQVTFVLHESFQNPKRDVEVGACTAFVLRWAWGRESRLGCR